MRFQDSWSYSFKVDLDDFSVEKYSCSKSFEHQLESLLSLGQAQEESLIPSCTCWEEPFPGDSIRYIGAGEVVVPGTDGSGTVGLSVPLRSLHWLQVMSYSQSQSQLPAGFVLTQPCWTATSWTVSGSDFWMIVVFSLISPQGRERWDKAKRRSGCLRLQLMRAGAGPEQISCLCLLTADLAT